MKKRNKVLALILALVMIMSLAACGGGDKKPSSSSEYGKSTAEATGDTTFDKLKSLYDVLQDDEYSYEDIKEILGCDGKVKKDEEGWWNEEIHTYQWFADGEYLYLTFDVGVTGSPDDEYLASWNYSNGLMDWD